MPYEVYLISSSKTEKKYVGITTKGYLNRFANHIWHSRKTRRSCRALYSAMNKYGQESFSVQLLETANSFDEMQSLEVKYIKDIGTLHPNGYNLTTGGDAGVMSDETKQIMSDRLKGVPMSQKNKDGLKRAWGDDSIREKRVKSIKEAMNRPEVRRQTSERQKGVKKSESHIKSIRASRAKPVRCICKGINFEAISDAVKWVKDNTEFKKASHAKIIRATKRSDYTAYGYRWEYINDPS